MKNGGSQAAVHSGHAKLQQATTRSAHLLCSARQPGAMHKVLGEDLKFASSYLQEYTAAAFSMCTVQQWTVVPLNPGEPLETALAIPKLPSMGTCWMGFVLAPTFQPSGGGPGGLSVMQVQWCALPHPLLIIDDPQQTAAIHPGMNLHEAVGPGAAAHCPAPHAAYS